MDRKLLGFDESSHIADEAILQEIKATCYTSKDVRPGWIGPGYPYTPVPEFVPLADWCAQHWAMYFYFFKYIKMIDPRYHLRIMDVGCGTGFATISIASLLRADVTGVDNDPAAIMFARKYNNSDLVHYHENDFFREEQDLFDYIFALEILEHIPAVNHELFVNRCLLKLKPEGLLFLTTPNALDQQDEVFGHIGLLNRHRAKAFIQLFRDHIVDGGFYDNKQLLSLDGSCVLEGALELFEKMGGKNRSHFRMVMKGTS